MESRSASPPTPLAGPSLSAGRFEVVRDLGGGGGGRVHLVRDYRQAGELRALKTSVRPGREDDAAAALELFHEARLLAALVHRGIPRLHDIGRSAEGPWMLMEYIEAETSAEDADPALLARSLLDVLGYLHRHGWLHLDVKPDNVVVAPGGRVVLLDYGLAVREGSAVPPRGTLPYVAPEVLAGEPPTPRSDLWSLGAVLLRLTLGRQLEPAAVLGPADVSDAVDMPLPADWLRRLLDPDPARRFPSADDARSALDEALGPEGAPPAPRPLPHCPVPAGRTSELEGLERHLRRASEESRQADDDVARVGCEPLVLLRGESGVGKSRVLFELRFRALTRGWDAYSASCADERDAPMPALGTIVEAVLSDADPHSPAVEKRGRAVASLLAARGDRSGAETAARFLVDRAAETRGLLLVVEDLQNATAMSLRVLGAIARAVGEETAAGRPVRLVVAVSLTEGVPLGEEIAEALATLEAEGVLRSMPVRPLGREDVVKLVRGVLGPHAPAERVADILRMHGGAHPLFGEELLSRLVEDGALVHDDGRWRIDTQVAPRLPESLQSAVSARLEELPPRSLLALQVVATHELPMPRVRAAALLCGDARSLLADLESRGLVTPAGSAHAISVVHSVIAHTALALLSSAGRERLHDAIAGCLPSVDPAAAVRRAYHQSHGADHDAGFRAATSAARRLRSEGEPGRAADFVRQALRLLDEGDPRIPTVRRSLAELLIASGRPAAATNVYRDLLSALRDDPVLRVKLQLGLAESLDAAGQSGEVATVCRAALHDLEVGRGAMDEGEYDDFRLDSLSRLAGAQRAMGDLHGAIESVKSALPLATEGRGAQHASLLALLGNVFAQMGELERSRQFHERCLAVCRGLGRRRGMATALHNLGVTYAREGRRDEAARSYRQSLRLARRARDLQGVAVTLGNLANLRAEQGDFTEAEALMRRSLALRRRIGDLAGIAATSGNLAGLHRARGRLGAALALLQSAAKRLRVLGDVHGEVQFLLRAAAIHLLASDPGAARALLFRALSRAQGASLRSLEAEANVLLGRLERRLDPEGEEWFQRLTRALELHRQVGDRAGTASALLEMALGERGRGRRGSAMRAWRMAHDLAAETGTPDLRARLDLVRGRLDADREPSSDALAALERFREYANASGRRDYAVASSYALARALLGAGQIDRAMAAVVESIRAEEDLSASLPPVLRRTREHGPVPVLLANLRERIAEAGAACRLDETDGGALGDDMDQDRLLKLLEINKQLALATDLRGLLDTIMDVATEATGAERGFLILVDDGKISFQAARNFRREEVATPELKVSRTLVKRVMKSGQPVLTDNATEDQRFAEFESVERLELKSIVSIPFRTGDIVIGALYLDNPARKGQFGPGDLQFLTALGDQATLAIRNLRHADQMQQLNAQLEQNLEKKSEQLEQASRALADRATKYPYDQIIGRSPEMRQVLLLVDKVVDTDVPVLINGESGTGKELIARAIHDYGRRKNGPFVTVNCGAIAETLMESEFFGHVKGAFTGAISDKPGLFRAADGGTIFLDEIGEMNFEMQKRLLRVLQEREVRPVGGRDIVRVDVRVIAATNRDLRKMMQDGSFREDLYYRVAVIGVGLPPLRERQGDIPMLVEFFKGKASDFGLTDKPFDQDAIDAMTTYSWPGNVRELDNEVKKALTLSDDRVSLDDLSVGIQGERAGPEPELVRPTEGATLKENLEKMERVLIEKALERTGGNQTRAAKDLGISRVWLRKKMERHALFDR